MKKMILTLVMTLAIITPAMGAAPTASRVDSIINEKVQGVERVREEIHGTLDDTIAAGGMTVEIGDRQGELSPGDIKVISEQWSQTVENIAYGSIWGVIALVLVILLFRYLNRRSKYRVIERAIESNYPLNELSLNDVKRSAIYVQQPVVTASPQVGQVPVGTPLQGQSPDNPIVMTDMVNWRAMMPAVKWIAWGVLLVLFSVAIGDFENPFWTIGLALVFVGLCKGFILYKEQKSLQEAWRRAGQQQPRREPMREGIPVPPPVEGYYNDVSAHD